VSANKNKCRQEWKRVEMDELEEKLAQHANNVHVSAMTARSIQGILRGESMQRGADCTAAQ
jgi:hypothetical protein